MQTSSPVPDRLQDVVIVKLGGSVITDKAKVDTFRPKVTARLACELKEAGVPLIIAHGTGSYGKPLAVKYHYCSGILESRRFQVAALAQQKVRLLHVQVLGVCLKQELSVTSLPPSVLFNCEGREVKDIYLEALIRHLKVGLIPTVYGDVVVDGVHGFSVCSSDSMVLALSQALQAKLAIFVCDVDGVYSSDPHQAQADNLIHEFVGAVPMVRASDELDVSGGMRYKVAVAQQIAQGGTECWIINGHVEGRLGGLLSGDRVVGTRFPARDGRLRLWE